VVVPARPLLDRDECHDDNHYKRVDRLRASGYSSNHTELSNRLRTRSRRLPMDALFVLLAALAAIVAVDLGGIDWKGQSHSR